MTTKLATNIAVDDPVPQTAALRTDRSDRRYIDDQVLAIQQHLVDSLLHGKQASWYRLSGSSAVVEQGHIVCNAPETSPDDFQHVTLATPSALATAGVPLGVVLQGGQPNGLILVATGGSLPSSVTGLAASAGMARVSASNQKAERIVTFTSTDYQLGTVDSVGNLTLNQSVQTQALGVVIQNVYQAQSNIAQAQAFRATASTHANPATTNFKTTPLAGLALQAITAGNSGSFQIAGPLDTAVKNLGPGVACAVGVDASGNPVRAIDPTCVSHKNWLGFCDTNGVITVQPKHRHHLFAPDYGAIENDSSSSARAANTGAWRAMINACGELDGDEIYWPRGKWYFAADLIVFGPTTHTGTGTGLICVTGTPQAILVTIKTGNKFRYSLDGGLTDNGADIAIPTPSGATYAVPATGVILNFYGDGATWTANDVYAFGCAAHVGTGTGVVIPSGTPTADYAVVVTIKAGTKFRYSLDGGVTDNGSDIAIPVGSTYTPSGTGITLSFSATGTWVASDTYSFGAYFPTCMQVVYPCHLRGAGSAYQSGTHLYFPDGTTGIKFWHFGQAPLPPVPYWGTAGYAAGSTYDRLYIEGEGARTNKSAHGIDVMTIITGYPVEIFFFGGDGLHVESKNGGLCDNCLFMMPHATYCFRGIYTHGGDANNCTFILPNVQNNRDVGIWEQSFLGNHFIGAHSSTNSGGDRYVSNTGTSTFIGCYSEGGQPPALFNTPPLVFGGLQGAAIDAGSQYAGGGNGQSFNPFRVLQNYGPKLVSAGTNPPHITLVGSQTLSSLTLSFRVDTAGYPGGFDEYSNPQTACHLSYSTDGGSTWTPFVPGRADGQNVSSQVIGSTGLTARFIPQLHSLDNTWSGSAFGGPQTYIDLGDYTTRLPVVFTFGHVDKTVANADPFDWQLKYNNGTHNWNFVSSNGVALRYDLVCGGDTLVGPEPGQLLFYGGIWGRDFNGTKFNRYWWCDPNVGAIGSTNWKQETDLTCFAFEPGDLLVNRSRTKPWPAALRVTAAGGYAYNGNYGVTPSVGAGNVVYPGRTFKSTVGGTSYIFKIGDRGTGTTAAAPALSATFGAVAFDANGVEYINAGKDWDANTPDAEYLNPVSAKLGVIDCTSATTSSAMALTENGAVGSLTASSAWSGYKLTNAGADFNVTVDKGSNGSWGTPRAFWNATSFNAYVAAAEGGASFLVSPGTSISFEHDGSQLMATNNLANVDEYTFAFTTTTNGLTTVFTTPDLPDNCASVAKIWLRGKQQGNNAEYADADLIVRHGRNNAGAPSHYGIDTNTVNGTTNLGTSVISYALSSNKLQLKITSGVNASVDWKGTVSIGRSA